MKNDNFLNQIRKRQGLKLRDVSARTGLSTGYLGSIFAGKLTFVPERTKNKIAAVLGLPKKVIF